MCMFKYLEQLLFILFLIICVLGRAVFANEVCQSCGREMFNVDIIQEFDCGCRFHSRCIGQYMRENSSCPTCGLQLNFRVLCRRGSFNRIANVEPHHRGGNNEPAALSEMISMTTYLMVHELLVQNWCAFISEYPILRIIPFNVARSLLVMVINDPSLLDRLERNGLNIRSLALEMSDLISQSLENAP